MTLHTTPENPDNFYNEFEDKLDQYDYIDHNSKVFGVWDRNGRKIMYDAVYFDICIVLNILIQHLEKLNGQISLQK